MASLVFLMAILPLTTGVENPILRVASQAVKTIDRKTKKLVEDMVDTMIEADGLGIAAPQVGVNLRIFIARLNFNTPHEMLVPMINAEFLELPEPTVLHEEGCLSIPGRFGMIRRAEHVTIRYMDTRGNHHTLKLDGLNARIMQHEMDHLEGTLIADKMEAEISAEDLKKARGKKKR